MGRRDEGGERQERGTWWARGMRSELSQELLVRGVGVAGGRWARTLGWTFAGLKDFLDGALDACNKALRGISARAAFL